MICARWLSVLSPLVVLLCAGQHVFGQATSNAFRICDLKVNTASNSTSTVFSHPRSALDRLLFFLADKPERTYSAPLSDRLYIKMNVRKTIDGRIVTVREHASLNRPRSHLLGTDKMGQDVLYITLKSVRSALIVGGLTTIIVIPFAILFGSLAGFFGGWIDDIIQYVYSTLSSIEQRQVSTVFGHQSTRVPARKEPHFRDSPFGSKHRIR